MKAIARFWGFLIEVREEVKHVSWPTREELFGSALIVLVGVTFLALVVYLWDQVLAKGVQLFLH